MSEENPKTQGSETPATETPATDSQPKVTESPKEIMIPKSRFDEVNNNYKTTKSEYEELQTKYSELETSSQKFTEEKNTMLDAIKRSSLELELTKSGVNSVDLALKAIDASSIEVGDDLKVDQTALQNSIEGLKNQYPVLFEKGKTVENQGFSGKDTSSGNKRIYTKEELKDSKFVSDNLEDIKLAQTEGRIR